MAVAEIIFCGQPISEGFGFHFERQYVGHFHASFHMFRRFARFGFDVVDIGLETRAAIQALIRCFGNDDFLAICECQTILSDFREYAIFATSITNGKQCDDP